MTKEPTKTNFPAGGFISENAVRVAFGRRAPTSPRSAEHTGSGAPAHTVDGTSAPAGGPRRLRRWSVAELIARAVRPPTPTT